MAGTVTITFEEYPILSKICGRFPSMLQMNMACVADADDASVPETAISGADLERVYGWWLFQVITVPGTTGPTDDTDFTLKDKYAVDVLGALGTDAIDNADNNYLWPRFNGAWTYPMTGPLTLAVTNNSVNSAAFTVQLLFSKYPVHYVAVS